MRTKNERKVTSPMIRFVQQSRTTLSLLAVFCMLLAAGASAQAQQSSPEAIRNYNQGIEAYNQGHTSEAIKKFEAATRANPAYADAYYNLGSIYYQSKNYSSARDMFQKAVNLNPSDGQSRYNLALCLEKLVRIEEAISVLSQIPSTDAKFAQARTKIEDLRPVLKAQNGETPAIKPVVTPAKLTATAFAKGFDGPTGIVIGPGGFMYVANYSKNLIYRVGASGEKTVFCKTDGMIKGPIGLAFNPKTNEIYVANYLLNNVVRINAAGKASVLVGNLTKPYNLFMDTINNTLFISEQDPANLVSKVALPK
jgi:cytochrome c-type biogenesis protein CcmH/NrfG